MVIKLTIKNDKNNKIVMPKFLTKPKLFMD